MLRSHHSIYNPEYSSGPNLESHYPRIGSEHSAREGDKGNEMITLIHQVDWIETDEVLRHSFSDSPMTPTPTTIIHQSHVSTSFHSTQPIVMSVTVCPRAAITIHRVPSGRGRTYHDEERSWGTSCNH